MSVARFGLPRCRRLSKSSNTEAPRRGHYKARDRCFALHAWANGLAHARLGVSVSRRVSLKAIVRNRIKRQVRDSFRLHQSALEGIDVVVVAQGPASETQNAELRKSLQQHWEKVASGCKRSSLV